MIENKHIPQIDPIEFSTVIRKCRSFFETKGFHEVHTQNRLSILAACEDPTTIATFNYASRHWPLPQTGQMWLEHELLKNPESPGFFCVSTSYRNEKNPVEGRHDLIFPMFEFELKGGMDELIKIETELLQHLGFEMKGDQYPHGDYLDIAKEYGVKELEHEHEHRLGSEHGPVYFLKNFPEYTDPFWNMSRRTGTANKVDVLLHGVETIGSAERSVDPEQMREGFQTISDGQYAAILYNEFTKERVDKELDDFLKYRFFDRSGGGIGVTRLIRAMKLSNLL